MQERYCKKNQHRLPLLPFKIYFVCVSIKPCCKTVTRYIVCIEMLLCVIIICAYTNIHVSRTERTFMTFRSGIPVTLSCVAPNGAKNIVWTMRDINGSDVIMLYCAYDENKDNDQCIMSISRNVQIDCMCVYGVNISMEIKTHHPEPGIHTCTLSASNEVVIDVVLIPDVYVNLLYNGWESRMIACGIYYTSLHIHTQVLVNTYTQIYRIGRCITNGESFWVYEDTSSVTEGLRITYNCRVTIETQFFRYFDQVIVYSSYSPNDLYITRQPDIGVVSLMYVINIECTFYAAWSLSICNHTLDCTCDKRWPTLQFYNARDEEIIYSDSDISNEFNKKVSFSIISSDCVNGKTRAIVTVMTKKGRRGIYSIYLMDSGGLRVLSAYVPHVISLRIDDQRNTVMCTMYALDAKDSAFVSPSRCNAPNWTLINSVYVAEITSDSLYTCTVRSDGCTFGTSISVYVNGSVQGPFITNVDSTFSDCAALAYVGSHANAGSNKSLEILTVCVSLIMFIFTHSSSAIIHNAFI